MRWKKIILWSVVTVSTLVIILGIFVFLQLKRSLPRTSGEIRVPSIKSNIEITYDAMGIPQIWAANDVDGCFAIGWLHASDRLFQMDLTRRVASGRLAELFGDLALDMDRLQRKMGHIRKANEQAGSLDYISLQKLNAYCDGVNAWTETIDVLPFEYLLLGEEFEAWKIEDCLAILSFQTWFSDALQNTDNIYNKLVKRLGYSRVQDLFPPYPPWAPKTVPQENKRKKDQALNYVYDAAIRGNIIGHKSSENKTTSSVALPFNIGGGSNCWVVSAERSKSGFALLASDPHLEITRLPQFWYQIGLHCLAQNKHVLGITTPGLPFFAYGHNGKTAWAFTAAGIDVTDQYIEKLNPENPEEYLTPTGWAKFNRVEELIWVKNQENPDTLRIRYSRHGPVFADEDSLREVITLRWAGFDQKLNEAVRAGFALSEIADFDRFRFVTTQFGALNANWMYADHEGNIGYQLGTPLPVRGYENSRIQVPGWTQDFEWQGYYDLKDTPHAYNPAVGWLASCNNKPDEGNLTYPLSGNFVEHRIMRINQLFNGNESFDSEDMHRFQMDLKADHLLLWKPEILRILELMGESEILPIIHSWDGNADETSRATALVEIWLARLETRLVGDDLGPLAKEQNYRLLFRDRVLQKIYFDDQNGWFDDIRTQDHLETRDDLAITAMKETLHALGTNTWGEIHTLTMQHPMAQVPLISTLLGLKKGPFSSRGTAGTLNVSVFNYNNNNKFTQIFGPSWRFIVDFKDVDKSSILLPAGQSGNPMSPHFFDFYDRWIRGERWVVPFSKNGVYDAAVSVLHLIPEKTND